ncbi:hypothetical protein HNQ94_000723 [Salirhabdus euzebyi]|uniref:YolD-like family protein n=1 Tax=Salirhabdus euzebyi TaxID=394506 RepID=A0A841Q320_9BACI|nr:YolD-like family protein [Salirhabdus euzebyi]MBB6452278.1 hypothetical protein [Salirhabdus euzebyi]
MLKDRGNIKWTSLMLPEHVVELKKMWEQANERPIPLLDEQELEEMNVKLQEAYSKKIPVQLTVHKKGTQETVNGIITKIDSFQQTLLLETDSEKKEIVPFPSIIYVK